MTLAYSPDAAHAEALGEGDRVVSASLCALDDQCCCLFGKMSFPPNEAVPLEFGCCGVYCLKNVEAIEEYEKKVAEAENDGVVEAVIVSKGGAPATVVADTMQRDIAKRN